MHSAAGAAGAIEIRIGDPIDTAGMTLHDRGAAERNAAGAGGRTDWRSRGGDTLDDMDYRAHHSRSFCATPRAQFGDRLALRQPAGKEVQTWTWNQYLEAAEEIAAGLHEIGIGKGDHMALCSETRAEFYLADQGILMNGSVAAALYPSYPPEELKRTIAHGGRQGALRGRPEDVRQAEGREVTHFILLTGEARGRCRSHAAETGQGSRQAGRRRCPR